MTEITELIKLDCSDLCDFKVDQTVICNKDYLPYVYRANIENEKPVKRLLDETYPTPLIYYPYTEDIDYSSRINKLLGQTHSVNKPLPPDPYFEDDADAQYLMSTPVSFLIVGKPEIGEIELARLLAEHWKCVNITPETVIREEILSGSRAGKCINFNLKCGRAIGPEVILRLVEKRVRTQTAQHRGFVISGFPLIPNLHFTVDPLSSESAIFNVQEIFEDLLPVPPEIVSPERPVSAATGSNAVIDEENPVSEPPTEPAEDAEDPDEIVVIKAPKPQEKKLDDDLDLGSTKQPIVTHTESFYALSTVDGQMEFLFTLFSKPMMIIYITCGNLDVVSKREKYRYDIHSEQEITFPDHAEVDDRRPSVAFLQENIEDENEMDGNRMKYIVRLPTHFKKSVSSQLRRFKNHEHPFIESKLMHHDAQHFIKVDGRLPAIRMFNAVRMRLKTLAFQPILVPEKLSDEEAPGEFDTAIEQTNLEGLPLDLCFKELQKRQIVSPMYKWQISNWGFKCPVALKEGRTLLGTPENALRFMNKIFFLSDEDAVLKFYRNPRQYILPLAPQPTCRIWVMGPKLCEKSVISQCLSYLFDCKLVNPVQLERLYRQRKMDEFVEQVRTAAITEGLMALNEKNRLEREEAVDDWKTRAVQVLETAYAVSVSRKSSGGALVRVHEEMELSVIEMNLPTVARPSVIKSLLENSDELLGYLPPSLKQPLEPATVFDPFISEYVETVLENTTIPDPELTLEEQMDMFQTAIQEAEEECYARDGRRAGWIVDGMPPNVELINSLGPQFMADDIICLRDEDPENVFLLTKFGRKDWNSFRDFRNFFTDMKKYFAADRAPPLQSTESSRLCFVNRLVERMHSEAMAVCDTSSDIDIAKSEKNKQYADQLTLFNELWFQTRDYLATICTEAPIEINVANKSTVQLMKEAVVRIEDRYRRTAKIITDEDRLQEMADFGGGMKMGEEEEEEEGEGDGKDKMEMFKQNRRFGDTNDFCPVAFYRHNVLWKGKEHFAAQYEHKIYCMSSEEALEAFVTDPRLILSHDPLKVFPPPRICVIGVTGSGKSSLAKQLSKNFGLFYINFESLVLDYLELDPTKDFMETLRIDRSLDERAQLHSAELDLLTNYLRNDVSLPNDVVRKILSPYWYSKPYCDVGFVLDNFPCRLCDIELMAHNFLIPDIVINLHVRLDLVTLRLFQPRFDVWKEEQNRKKLLKRLENDATLDAWRTERYARFQELADQVRETRRQAAKESAPKTRILTTPVDSKVSVETEIMDEIYGEDILSDEFFIYDPIQEQEDLEQVNKQLDVDMPQPVFDDVWESDEDATERLKSIIEIEFSQEIDVQNLMVAAMKDEMIDVLLIDTTANIFERVIYEVIRCTDKYKFRNQSLFERVYEITMDVVERLLEQGYYFISKFGRTCPVQVYERVNPVQMFLPAEYKVSTFPLIHRRYIYFTCSEENKNKFKYDPLLYVMNEDSRFPLIPLKVAIIGPPKSGKSTLAERLQKELSLKIITKGQAVRYVLRQMPYCELAQNMKIVLDKGWSLTNEMTSRAVEALTLDGKSISQGFVLDGFPSTTDEMKHLVTLGIVPHVVLDMQINCEKMKEYTKNETRKRNMHPYSITFIRQRYDEWKRSFKKIRECLDHEYQNLFPVQNMDTKWHMWVDAKKLIFRVLLDMQRYLDLKNYDSALSIKSLCATPDEYFKRQGAFKTYCPCCIYYDNFLTDGGIYPDRSGVVQFMNDFYWLCKVHVHKFLENPKMYLPPENTSELPADLPLIVKSENLEPMYQDGLCVVTFWESQPHTILRKGDTNFAVNYKGFYYIFCSEDCLRKFLKTPHEYFDKVIHFREPTPPYLVGIEQLPTLGYLEQYAANLLVKAVVNTEMIRPLHPGLTIAKSAALNIGLFLKKHNPKTPKEILPIYKEAMEKYHDRRKKLKIYLHYFKSQMNPFLCLEDYTKKKKPKRKPCDTESTKSSSLFSETTKIMDALDMEFNNNISNYSLGTIGMEDYLDP